MNFQIYQDPKVKNLINDSPQIVNEPGEPAIAKDNNANASKKELPATADELNEHDEIINEPEDVEEQSEIDQSPAE